VYRLNFTLIIQFFTIICFLFFQNTVSGAEHPELKAFPAAKEGMDRFVIVLPPLEKEDTSKIEIIPGKVMLTDGVNLVRLGTTVEPRTLMGWGYTYYEVTGSDVVMSTMMAPPEDGKQVERFVAGTPLLVRYNSRLPVVVYAPVGSQVRYRIWEASETTGDAEKK
jgi:ecotin